MTFYPSVPPVPSHFGNNHAHLRLPSSCGTAGGGQWSSAPPRPSSSNSSTSSVLSNGSRKRSGSMDDDRSPPHFKQPRHNADSPPESGSDGSSSVNSVPMPYTPISPEDDVNGRKLGLSSSSSGSIYSVYSNDDIGHDPKVLGTDFQHILNIGSAQAERITNGATTRRTSFSGQSTSGFGGRNGIACEGIAAGVQSNLPPAPVISVHPSPPIDPIDEDLETARKRSHRASMPVQLEQPRSSARSEGIPAYGAFRPDLQQRRIPERQSYVNGRPQPRIQTSHVPTPSRESLLRIPAERMVAVSVVAIESIWKCPEPVESVDLAPGRKRLYPAEQHLPLEEFVRETIRRSRTSIAVHQLALVYLHRARHRIHDRVLEICKAADKLQQLITPMYSARHGSGCPTPPSSPPRTKEAAELWRACNDPIGDGRKMFLAALMCAWKFAQDSNYSNKAWSKITGLDVLKVTENERLFLNVVDFNLNMTPDYFSTWIARLDKLANDMLVKAATSGSTSPSPISPQRDQHLPSTLDRPGSLSRRATEYAPAPPTSEPKAGGIAHFRANPPPQVFPKSSTESNVLNKTRRQSLPSPVSPEESFPRHGFAAPLPPPGTRRGASSLAGVGHFGRMISSGGHHTARMQWAS